MWRNGWLTRKAKELSIEAELFKKVQKQDYYGHMHEYHWMKVEKLDHNTYKQRVMNVKLIFC